MLRLLGCLLISIGVSTLPNAWTAWASFENGMTVYMVSCDGARIGGLCHGDERAGVPFTYQVSLDEHSVTYRTMNDPGLPRTLPFCVIRDVRSWLCQWNRDEVPKIRFGMVGGNYVEISVCTTDAPGPMFYQVSQWHWWRVRLRETFSRTEANSRSAAAMIRTRM